MFAFYGNICQGNCFVCNIHCFFCLRCFLCCFLGVFLIIGCKRCCFISNLRHALCLCLILGHYCCLCHRCGCQNNRVNNSLSGIAAAACAIAARRSCRCGCGSQTLDHLIQLSACLIQAVQNLLQSIFCILFVLFSHGQLSFQFLQSSKVTGSVTLQSFDLCLQHIYLALCCFHLTLCCLCIL